MSLDITLTIHGKITYDNGLTYEDYSEDVFEKNITHNLTTMADECGLYEIMWRPENMGITKAGDATLFLLNGILELKSNRQKYEQYNPSNGWGSYDGLLRCAESYLEACELYPNAIITVSR